MSNPRKAAVRQPKVTARRELAAYGDLVGGIAGVLEAARRASARAVNAVMTATYWEIGRRIVEYEQGGRVRAVYGETLLEQLSGDLTSRYGRGFGVDNLQRFRLFFLSYPADEIYATPSRKSLAPPPAGKSATPSRISREEQILQTPSEKSSPAGDSATLSRISGSAILQTPSAELLTPIASRFPLPWSAYVRLLAVKNEHARSFYETEALRAGWSVRQLDRQIQSQFYERTTLSRNKAAMLAKGTRLQPGDAISPVFGERMKVE